MKSEKKQPTRCQNRKTLHDFIMREAAVCGRMKPKQMPTPSEVSRHTLTDAVQAAGTAGAVWFERGIAEGYQRVLNSSRTMTRTMLIAWLEREVKNAP